MTWSDAAIAGAFVLGAIGGTVATIRITRALLGYLRAEQQRASPPPAQGRSTTMSTTETGPATEPGTFQPVDPEPAEPDPEPEPDE